MLEITWTGQSGAVPYVGEFQRGKTYTLPTAQAQRFINEGRATLVAPDPTPEPEQED